MNRLFVFSTITIINDNELIDKEQNACYIVVLHMISIVSYKENLKKKLKYYTMCSSVNYVKRMIKFEKRNFLSVKQLND